MCPSAWSGGTLNVREGGRAGNRTGQRPDGRRLDVPTRRLIRVPPLFLLMLALAAPGALATNVQPRLDLFTTPIPPPGFPTSGTDADFSSTPLPAGLFCGCG